MMGASRLEWRPGADDWLSENLFAGAALVGGWYSTPSAAYPMLGFVQICSGQGMGVSDLRTFAIQVGANARAIVEAELERLEADEAVRMLDRLSGSP